MGWVLRVGRGGWDVWRVRSGRPSLLCVEPRKIASTIGQRGSDSPRQIGWRFPAPRPKRQWVRRGRRGSAMRHPVIGIVGAAVLAGPMFAQPPAGPEVLPPTILEPVPLSIAGPRSEADLVKQRDALVK